MKTIELKFYELCDEIDFYKEEAIRWKEKYDELMQESFKETKERIEAAQRGVAKALMFALSTTTDKNGNLIINKENRKQLSKNWKS
jgi:hypothetical protein